MPLPSPKATLLCALILAASALPGHAEPTWQGVPIKDIVAIHGRVDGQKKLWDSYQNGCFSQDNYANEFFKVPPKRTLVIVEAEVSIMGDPRKNINIEILVDKGKFPLGRASFTNTGGSAAFTASKTFPMPLVIPQMSQTGQQGLVNLAVHGAPATGKYTIILHGFYTE